MLLTEQELVLLTVSCTNPSLVCHFCVFYIILLIWLLIQERVLRTVYETILICVSRCSVRQLLTPRFFLSSFFSIASSLAHGDTLQFVVLRYRECHGLKCSCCCPVRSAQKTYTMAFCFKPWCCKLGFYFKNLCWKLRYTTENPLIRIIIHTTLVFSCGKSEIWLKNITQWGTISIQHGYLSWLPCSYKSLNHIF